MRHLLRQSCQMPAFVGRIKAFKRKFRCDHRATFVSILFQSESRFYLFATPLLSHRVRICRFLTENTVCLRAFFLANFEISNSYSFGLEWHMTCSFSPLLGAPKL
jgi:hypothetical protein